MQKFVLTDKRGQSEGKFQIACIFIDYKEKTFAKKSRFVKKWRISEFR